jgi:hypothetical protein
MTWFKSTKSTMDNNKNKSLNEIKRYGDISVIKEKEASQLSGGREKQKSSFFDIFKKNVNPSSNNTPF